MCLLVGVLRGLFMFVCGSIRVLCNCVCQAEILWWIVYESVFVCICMYLFLCAFIGYTWIFSSVCICLCLCECVFVSRFLLLSRRVCVHVQLPYVFVCICLNWVCVLGVCMFSGMLMFPVCLTSMAIRGCSFGSVSISFFVCVRVLLCNCVLNFKWLSVWKFV